MKLKYIYFPILIFCVANSSCEKNQHDKHGNKKDVKSGSGSADKQVPRKAAGNARRQANNLNRDYLINSNLWDQSVKKLHELANQLAKEEETSYSIALNELYMILSKERNPGYLSSINGVFIQALLNNPDGIAKVMAELPAGDLRRLGIAGIRGMVIPTQELRNIYDLMPESTDRYEIANLLVVQLSMEASVDEALDFVSQISVLPERDGALSALASSMSLSAQFGGREFSIEEKNRVKSYARSINREKSIEPLK